MPAIFRRRGSPGRHHERLAAEMPCRRRCSPTSIRCASRRPSPGTACCMLVERAARTRPSPVQRSSNNRGRRIEIELRFLWHGTLVDRGRPRVGSTRARGRFGSDGRRRRAPLGGPHNDIKKSLYPRCAGPLPCYRHPARACRPGTSESRQSRTDMTAASKAAKSAASRRFRHQGHRARRMGPQGNRHRRDRDARPDGDPRGTAGAAAARRAHLRLAAHDHPDRGADRDASRRSAPTCAGPRATSIRPRTMPPPRSPPTARRSSPSRARRSRLLGLSASDLRVGRRRHPEHDPRRRRRRHAAHPSRAARRTGRKTALLNKPTNEEEEVLFAAIKQRLKDKPGWYKRNAEGIRGVTEGHDRRPPALRDARRRARCCGRRSTSTTASPSRSSTTSTAANRWSTASAAAPT